MMPVFQLGNEVPQGARGDHLTAVLPQQGPREEAVSVWGVSLSVCQKGVSFVQ